MIKIAAALANVQGLFLDTAPIIYHVEGILAYQPLTDQIFQAIQARTLSAVTSKRVSGITILVLDELEV